MKKALLVIDLQNDYLGEQRKSRFTYNTASLIESVNKIIGEYQASDVIYIKHVIQNIWTNRLLFGHALEGTSGAEFYGGLKIVSENIFTKHFFNAFSSAKLKAFIKENKYESVAICGLDERWCVSATAMGAIKNNLKVEMLTKGIATTFPDQKIAKLREKLKKKGVVYL